MILNKCPICGSELEYNSLYQFTKIYKVLKNGKCKDDACPMECGFISCINPDCDFHTNCDLEVEGNGKYNIYQSGDVYNIEIDEG